MVSFLLGLGSIVYYVKTTRRGCYNIDYVVMLLLLLLWHLVCYDTGWCTGTCHTCTVMVYYNKNTYTTHYSLRHNLIAVRRAGAPWPEWLIICVFF